MARSSSAGRSSRRWLQVLVPNVKAQARAGRPCHFCHQRIDVDLPSSEPASFQAHHIKSRRLHPELAEEPSNIAPSHRLCNRLGEDASAALQLSTERPSLGTPSREW